MLSRKVNRKNSIFQQKWSINWQSKRNILSLAYKVTNEVSGRKATIWSGKHHKQWESEEVNDKTVSYLFLKINQLKSVWRNFLSWVNLQQSPICLHEGARNQIILCLWSCHVRSSLLFQDESNVSRMLLRYLN